MPLASHDLTAAARRLPYHQRMALMLIAQGRGRVHGLGVGSRTIKKLLTDGLVIETEGGLTFSDRGAELHKALQQLGWLPPRND